MLRRLRTFTAATLIAVGATAGAGFSSHALADHINQTMCFPAGPSTQVCITVNGATNTTTTPSGNESDTFNGTQTVTFTDSSGTVLQSETDQIHFHTLYQNGIPQEVGEHVTGSLMTALGTCTFSIDFHLANGQVQYDHFSSSGACP